MLQIHVISIVYFTVTLKDMSFPSRLEIHDCFTFLNIIFLGNKNFMYYWLFVLSQSYHLTPLFRTPVFIY